MRSSRLSLETTKLDEKKTLSSIPTINITSYESLLYHPLLVTSSSQRTKAQISNSPSTYTSSTSSSSVIFKTPGLNQVIEETKIAKQLRRNASSDTSSSLFSSYADTSSSSSSPPQTTEMTKMLSIPVSKDDVSSFESTTSLLSSRAFHSSILDSLMNIDYNEETDDNDSNILTINDSVLNSKSSHKRELETDQRLRKSLDKLSGYPTSSTTIYSNERNNEEEDVNFNGLNGLLSNTSIESLQAELKATQAVLKTLRSENSELRFAKSPTVATPLRQTPSSPPPPLPHKISEEQEHYAEVLLAQAEAAKALSLANASSALRRAAAMAKSSSINQKRIKEGVDNIYELVKEAIELVDNE